MQEWITGGAIIKFSGTSDTCIKYLELEVKVYLRNITIKPSIAYYPVPAKKSFVLCYV